MNQPETSRKAIPPQLSSDLELLRNKSKKDMPSLENALGSAIGQGAYRDGHAGAIAKRASLLAARQLELALLPLATGRIFVHRVSRIAAGSIAAVAALLTVALVADPTLFRLAKFFLPGLNISLIVVGTVTAVLGAYVLAGVVAEYIFERRMRAALASSGDVFSDIDSLRSGPVREARKIADSLESFAVALPLIGVATCAPLFAYLGLVLSSSLASGYSAHNILAASWVGGNIHFIVMAMAVGSTLAVLIGRACGNEQTHGLSKPLSLRFAGSWMVIPCSIVLGLVTLMFIGRAASGFGALPSEELRLMVAIGGTLAVLGPVTWAALLLRSREARRLQVADSTGG